VVLGNQFDDAAERADLDRVMIQHRNVKLATDVRGQADM